MNPQDIPLEPRWWSCELKGYRPRQDDSTYVSERYESLPPLPTSLLGKDFEWLKSQPIPPKGLEDPRLIGPRLEWWRQGYNTWKTVATEKIGNIKSIAVSNRVTIPREFYDFIGNADLVSRIRTFDDSYFMLPQAMLPWPPNEAWSLIPFLSDSTDTLWWYLLVDDKHDHCVVAQDRCAPDPPRTDKTQVDNWWFCEESFESFVLRFWIENEIWFRLSFEETTLDVVQQEYVNHYRN